MDHDIPTNVSAQGTVNLENWRRAPWNRWAFGNVRRLLPTAAIAPGTAPRDLDRDPRDLSRLPVHLNDGETRPLARVLGDTCTDGLVVLRGGRVVWEWYDTGHSATRPHLLFSVSKSILGLAVGIAVGRGLIDPDRQVTDYVPELGASSAYATATVRHLLDMEVGIDFDETYDDPRGDVKAFRVAAGWDPEAGDFRATGLRPYLTGLRTNGQPHGERFHYVSTNSDALGWVLDSVSRRHYADCLSDWLWAPLGARHEANLALDPRGVGRASGGISASVRDIALVGELMRTRGVVDGQPVVPGSWVDDIRRNGRREAWLQGKMTALFPQGAYRNHWYNVTSTTVCAGGIHGQWIYVDDDAEMVIARVASQPRPMDYDVDRLCLRVFQCIGEALRLR